MSEEEVEEEGDDDIPYNPKNLPLGWDGKFIALDNIYLVVWYEINTSLQSGKPIPYWLYKLHGLNISYNCEICGNFTYKGPKAFQRHFAGRFILKSSPVILSLNICNLFQSGVMLMA